MSRALRRHPLVNKPPAKAPAFRPGGARQAKREAATAAPETAKRRNIPFQHFFQDIFSELKKVSWPTREETMRLTLVIVVVSVAIGMALGGVDLAFNWAVDHTLLR